MKCESCQTEFTGDACPKCGLKLKKAACKDCMKKFYSTYLTNGLCPECLEKEKHTPHKNPYLASGMSVIPGLGHVYLGLPIKGAMFLAMLGLSIIIPVIGWIMLPFAFLIPIVDAYKTAIRMNLLKESIEI